MKVKSSSVSDRMLNPTPNKRDADANQPEMELLPMNSAHLQEQDKTLLAVLWRNSQVAG